MKWEPIDTAKRDGTVIHCRRVLKDGAVFWEGHAMWGSFHKGALHCPLSGDMFAGPAEITGWRYADKDFLVPQPTEWSPDMSNG